MAEASPPTKTEALSNIDPRYLGEYVEFSGQLREYVKDTLSKAFRTDPNPVRRSHHIISLVQLEYAAYEDASAILKALISTRQGKTNTVLEVLESYKPGEAVLASVLDESSAETAEKLYAALRLEEAIPAEWASWLPSLDLKKSLLLACRFFVSDCRTNQKELGMAAYNKSKHGPLVIAKGDLFGPALAPVPSMFFANKWPAKYGTNPVIVHGFPNSDEMIENRERSIHFVQRSLRLLVAVLLGHMYPAEVSRRWGSLELMWYSNSLRDVVGFVAEITVKK
jgi:hypothetical protein